jgi:hypothetical protein
MHPFGQLHVRQPAVVLQGIQNLAVDRIELRLGVRGSHFLLIQSCSAQFYAAHAVGQAAMRKHIAQKAV